MFAVSQRVGVEVHSGHCCRSTLGPSSRFLTSDTKTYILHCHNTTDILRPFPSTDATHDKTGPYQVLHRTRPACVKVIVPTIQRDMIVITTLHYGHAA